MNEFLQEYSNVVPKATIKSELVVLTIIEKVLKAEDGFFGLHFASIYPRFDKQAPTVLEGLLKCRQDVDRSLRNEVMQDFFKQFPQLQESKRTILSSIITTILLIASV